MLKNKKSVAILGSTGSIGTQALTVIRSNKDLFSVFLLSCKTNHELLWEQISYFKPKYAIISSKEGYLFLKNKTRNLSTVVYCGQEALCDLMSHDELNVVLTAVVGSFGLLPTIAAISAKKNIALANKETLVIAGDLIMRLAKKNNVRVFPVDSEHSAIFQCLVGEDLSFVKNITLTASGGPFLNLKKSQFKNISLSDALRHPNWSMGNKITIDSATMMNKGFELIEARWLFGVSQKKIKIVVHPQSIVHSFVEFCDGSVKAQLGWPDMTVPIMYSLSFPKRLKGSQKDLDLTSVEKLEFFSPDPVRFPHLDLAYRCLDLGGSAACALNAANEVVVEAFLKEKIGFLNMYKIIALSLEKSIFVKNPTLEDYLSVDAETRKTTNKLIYKK